jgi:glycosyltransferase involved in cell wall biosynthesis
MRSPALRAGFLTHTPPLPAVSGERIRNWSLLRELARRGWDVSLFSLVHEGAAPGQNDEEELRATCAEVLLAPFTVGSTTRRVHVLWDTLRRRPFHERYFLSREAASASRRWLEQGSYDVVVIGTLYMVPYVPKALLSRSVLDTHNSETRRVAVMADTLGLSPQGIVARLQREPVAGFERTVAQRVARLTAVSEEERAIFEPLAPGRVDLVSNGVDCEALRPRAEQPAGRRILFLGSLDYSPNVDAVSHLVDDVLPHLRDSGVTLDLVGSHPRKAVHAAARRSPVPVEVAGHVPDTAPYWDRARALVVPLRIGGGTRLKILEALARGVPVVSTTIGCEGLGLRPGDDLLVADDPRELAAAVERLLGDDDLCRALAAHGRATVEARYDWRVIGDAFERSLGAVASLKP